MVWTNHAWVSRTWWKPQEGLVRWSDPWCKNVETLYVNRVSKWAFLYSSTIYIAREENDICSSLYFYFKNYYYFLDMPHTACEILVITTGSICSLCSKVQRVKWLGHQGSPISVFLMSHQFLTSSCSSVGISWNVDGHSVTWAFPQALLSGILCSHL